MNSFMQTIWYQVIKIALYFFLIISGVGVVSIPIFFADKLMKPRKNYVSGLSIGKRLGQLSPTGRTFIACALISIITGIIAAKLDSKETSNEQKKEFAISDSVSKKHFKEVLSLQLNYHDSLGKLDRDQQDFQNRMQNKLLQDSVSRTNYLISISNLKNENLKLQLKDEHRENIRLQSEINSPNLNINYSENNPKMYYDTPRNSICFDIAVENIGKGVADSAKHHFTLIHVNRENKLEIYINTLGAYDETMGKYSNGPTYTFRIADDTMMFNKREHFYIALEVTYLNSFHQKRPPLQEIYNFSKGNIFKPIPLLSDRDIQILREYLIKEKIWQITPSFSLH